MKRDEIRSLIRNDLTRYAGRVNSMLLLKHLLLTPGFRYTYLLRRASRHADRSRFSPKRLMYRLALRQLGLRYGYEIAPETSIGPGFYIGHFGGIALNPGCVLGCNVNISKGVTLGAERRGPRAGAPKIGNYVWIGANAAVVGNIKVGDNVLIAPNAYVNFDVPRDSIVIGNPARVIGNCNATHGYINRAVS